MNARVCSCEMPFAIHGRAEQTGASPKSRGGRFRSHGLTAIDSVAKGKGESTRLPSAFGSG